MENLEKPRMRRAEAVVYLMQHHGIEIAISTLATMATRGGGPLFQKNGQVPLYTPAHLDEWALARLGQPRASTSAAA